jgi:hypothetical protein
MIRPLLFSVKEIHLRSLPGSKSARVRFTFQGQLCLFNKSAGKAAIADK